MRVSTCSLLHPRLPVLREKWLKLIERFHLIYYNLPNLWKRRRSSWIMKCCRLRFRRTCIKSRKSHCHWNLRLRQLIINLELMMLLCVLHTMIYVGVKSILVYWWRDMTWWKWIHQASVLGLPWCNWVMMLQTNRWTIIQNLNIAVSTLSLARETLGNLAKDFLGCQWHQVATINNYKDHILVFLPPEIAQLSLGSITRKFHFMVVISSIRASQTGISRKLYDLKIHQKDNWLCCPIKILKKIKLISNFIVLLLVKVKDNN